MKEYLVIQADEDGDPCSFMSKDEVNKFLQEKEDCNVKFMDEIPEDTDTNYWKENEILIIKIEYIVTPTVKLSI